MRKRMLKSIVSIAMVLSLLAAFALPAFADSGPSEFEMIIGDFSTKSNGTYTSTECIAIKKGKVIVDGNKITLDNVEIVASKSMEPSEFDNGLTIYNPNDTTIELVGKNTIKSSSAEYGVGLVAFLDDEKHTKLTITSSNSESGSLDVTGTMTALGSGTMDILNCSVKAISTGTSDCNSENFDSVSGIVADNLTINNSNVTASGQLGMCSIKMNIDKSTINVNAKYEGLFTAEGAMVINNSTITSKSTEDESSALSSDGGSISLNNSTINAESVSASIFAFGGDISFTSCNVNAKCTDIDSSAIMTKNGKIIIGEGNVIRSGGNVVNVNGDNGEYENVISTNNMAGEDDRASMNVVIEKVGIVNTSNSSSNISNVTLPSKTDLQDAVLTPEDKAAINSGANVDIKLNVNKVDKPADAGVVDKNLNGNTLGMYLDISILKNIGGTKSQVHNLNKPIRITISLPENLKGFASYSIIRVHEGVATVLKDLDSDPNTVTFETDRLSTYALVHTPPKGSIPSTGENSALATVGFISLTAITAIVLLRKKF